MVAVRENFPRFTPEEYFAWEEQQLDRHEYINGEVYAMSGGTKNHSDVAGNFLILLKSHLRGSGCKTFNSDLRVNIVESTNYVYPDLSVTCNERDKATTQYITYPCLIIEVLSPSTEAYDRGNKFRMYRQNPVLQEYVLVDADSVSIEMFRKNDGNNWQIINYQAGDLVELKSVDLTFSIEDVYEGIIFE
ncbi:Uma2 family endonuclease [Chamaesiphon sp. VAR_48_metabat_135_sub]|uniref:Uma2 family endonuclease n=1 Tax=Chamaesiphon sp. VAR_48_metabat_135_sub TaxID=2964699 RepID=UPI00286B9732|nr:Uma2 family endonuclease [Chamaesiphon sp. VAR_48_metabat_135_sub]